MRTWAGVVLCTVIAVAWLTGCESIPDPASATIEGVDGYTPYHEYAYLEFRDTIHVIIPKCNCIGDSLDQYVQYSKHAYIVDENTLEIVTGIVEDADGSGATVSIWESYSRVSGSQSIVGKWEYDSSWYTADATPNEAAIEAAETELERVRALKRIGLKITKATITMYFDTETPLVETEKRFATTFLKEWKDTLETTYAITIDSITDTSVTITGSVTNEVVTVKHDADGNIFYESTDQTHATYMHSGDPFTCPNPLWPDWIDEFLQSNQQHTMYLPSPFRAEERVSHLS